MPHRHILSARHLLGAIAGLSLGALSLQPAQAADDIIRLATTTSTYNSGLLDNLLPAYEQANDVTVQVIAVGTGKALRMGQDGDVDLVMTHAPGAERKFVDAGYGIEPHGVMYNDFVLLGPKADPANVEGMSDVDAALARIAESNAGFDLWLKDRDPQSGVRDFEWINELASQAGLNLLEDNIMPANNQLLVWEKSQ